MRYWFAPFALLMLLLGAPAEAQTPAAVNGCVYISGGITLSNGQRTAFQCDVNGKLLTTGGGGGGSGTVTSVSVTPANGVSGVVATPTSTPAITLSLGAITPASINGIPVGPGKFAATYATAAGVNALSSTTVETSSTAYGYNALGGLTTGLYSVGVGESAGAGANASNGVFIGSFSAETATGNYVTAIGANAYSSITSGGFNTGVGGNAGTNLKTGALNTLLAYNAGSAYTTSESYNTIVGAIPGVAGQSSTIQLGDGAGNVRLDYNATVGNHWTMAGVGGDATLTDNTMCVTAAGTIYKGSGTLGICLGTSSARYKRDIKPLRAGLPEILSLNPKSFFYKSGHGDDGARLQFGFIAEDVATEIPGVVGFDDRGKPNTVDILAMVPMLVAAIKTQQLEIAELRAKIDAGVSDHD